MTDIAGPSSVDAAEDEARRAERVSALARLYDADGPADLDELTGPVYWPDLTPGEARQEWASLRTWVEALVGRFPHLDHHVIPRCWYRHPGHVEALAALRDAERVNFAETAPGTAGVDWHRAFQTIEIRLRDWTGQLACGATHESRTRQSQPIDPTEWEQFVTEDGTRRAHHPIATALDGEGRRVAAGLPTP